MPKVHKTSSVWQYFFNAGDDENFSACSLCNSKISRGGTGKKAGTTSLKRHLERKHSDIYGVVGTSKIGLVMTTKENNDNSPSTSSKSVQQSIEQVLERKKLWDINDPRSKSYHKIIGEMIAVDMEPLTIVDSHVGFKRLLNKAVPQYQIPSRFYFTENVIPNIYETVVAKFKTSLDAAENIAFTSDMWTCSVNNRSFLSLTAHWISENFALKYAVLAMKYFPEKHTADNISQTHHECMNKWQISDVKITVIVHDNGANMVKGAKDFRSVRCFIHTLQLVITDAIKATDTVQQTLTAARRIVTHFSHSGFSNLKKIQTELNLTQHILVQDVSTRWNSSYYMLERLYEQKRAISIYNTDTRNLNFENLTSEQWEIVEELIMLLKPFEEVTKITSSTFSSIADVIPHVITLMRYLTKPQLIEKTAYLYYFRTNLKENIQSRFNMDSMIYNPSYALATFLDPRYMDFFFEGVHKKIVSNMLLREALKLCLDEETDSDLELEAETKSKPTTDDGITDINKKSHDLFWECFNETKKESDMAELLAERTEKNDAAKEIKQYLSKNREPPNTSLHDWWSRNGSHFPILTKLAKKLFATPSSSVYSERLFSEAGLVNEEKRNRLDPNRAEALVFLRHNLPLIDFNY